MAAISAAAQKILSALEKNGYEAFVVGGCVRDSLMGKTPQDFDICTSALPEQTIKCFEEFQIIKTGLKHGTITVLVENKPYEVTSYRIDGEYKDNRRPDKVQFVSDLKEDLSRRDFTINAIAYNPKTGIIDCYNGKKDILKKIIRCVGQPDRRFNEDALRIMRGLRFASVFGFEIEEQTAQSIERSKALLKNISAERIKGELCKLLLGIGAEDVLIKFVNILEVIIPEISAMKGFNQNSPYHCFDVWQHTVKAVGNAPKDIVIRLTMLFHDIAKPFCYTQDEQGTGHFYGHNEQSVNMATVIMRRLKFDNETINSVRDLIFYHSADLQPSRKPIKRLLNKIGEEKVRQLIQVKKADTMGKVEDIREERLFQLAQAEQCINEIIMQQQCFSIKDLAVNGNDLLKIGFEQGKSIGITLERLTEMIINEDIENEKEILLKTATSLI